MQITAQNTKSGHGPHGLYQFGQRNPFVESPQMGAAQDPDVPGTLLDRADRLFLITLVAQITPEVALRHSPLIGDPEDLLHVTINAHFFDHARAQLVEVYGDGQSVDIETMGMEFSVLLKEVRNAAALLEAGNADEITLRTDKFLAVVRVVDEEYFLAMSLSPDGNIGKARYVLRMLAPNIHKEIA